MKLKKCPECRQPYQPVRQMQPCCDSDDCKAAFAIRHIEAERKRRRMRAIKAERVAQVADRKVIRAKKEKLKTIRDWTRETQSVFNQYIRERDKGQLCICCNQPLSSGDIGGQYDCGHYRSVGSAPHLRFDPRNAAAQRKQCNRWGAGRAVDYRLGLIARIGIEAVESLEADNTARKYSIEDLKAIKDHYKQLLKEMKN